MAAAIPKDDERLVVELGGGTGSITRVLLDSGIAPGRLVVIEQHAEFADMLKQKFPGITVLNQDAQRLSAALQNAGLHQPVGCIVSGLPLLTLPTSVRTRIIAECSRLLPADGQFLQFTYGYRSPVPVSLAESAGLTGKAIGSVWTNIPPATVWSYRPQAALAGSVARGEHSEADSVANIVE